MAEITAVILAAGLGLRMGPRGEMTPKGLIEMGGQGLVPQSVETLRRWGAERIAVVTGHLAEQYQAAFAGTDVQLIHNPAYDSTGSLKTLLTALEQIDGVTSVAPLDGDVGRYRLACGAEADPRKEVFRLAVSRDWVLLELAERKASLEDVFVRLTNRDEDVDSEDVDSEDVDSDDVESQDVTDASAEGDSVASDEEVTS